MRKKNLNAFIRNKIFSNHKILFYLEKKKARKKEARESKCKKKQFLVLDFVQFGFGSGDVM